MNGDLMRAALDAAGRGWPVFPLRPGAKRPALHSEARCPGTGACTDRHRKWEQRATTDPDRIRAAWSAGAFNVGIATGPAGLVVLDLDVAKGKQDAPGGAATFKALCERTGQPVPDTFTLRTTSGGEHRYFTAPPGTRLGNTAGTLAPHIDTRAHGGYVVAAGSTVGGRSYAVIDSAPVVPLPAWLLERLRPTSLPDQRRISVSLHRRSRSNRYLRAAIDGELQRVICSGPNQHNTALYHSSVALGQLVAGGALTAYEVTEWLTDAGTRVGQSEREARATIASGLRAGAHRPRQVGR
ncbi:bifunctional DNA primase/polymerase [Streptomyces sp. NPDC004134]|uniref:bifunctional DNA primase/polymerase n=1 Tax=Streptomyces sp. NPDC004134 TaxID=3364691 RepID=UPI0036C1D917